MLTAKAAASRTNTYDKLSERDHAQKLKQLQQRSFTRANESNENTTKASYEAAMLIAKHDKPFTEGEFIRLCYKNSRTCLP